MRNEERYFMRGERMFEANCVCRYDLLSFIPSLGDPAKTIKQDTTASSPAGTRNVLLGKSRTAALALVTAIVCVTSASAQVPPAQAPPAQAPPTAQGTQAQNPLTPLWGVINENYTNFKMGPLEKTQNILIVEPVFPLKLTPGWNLITRWNTPIIWMPRLAEPGGPFPTGVGPEFGLSNMQPQFFFTPVSTGSFSWAVGPSLWLPTATDPILGINKWGGGPVVVALTIQGSLLAGFLAQNLWAGTHGTSVTGTRVNTLTVMPFVFYNFPGGWFVTYRPLITADWTVDDNRWTVPIGGGFGRVFPVGDMVMDIHVQGFYNGLTSPAAGITNVGKGTAMLVVHFLFPKAPVPSLF